MTKFEITTHLNGNKNLTINFKHYFHVQYEMLRRSKVTIVTDDFLLTVVIVAPPSALYITLPFHPWC